MNTQQTTIEEQKNEGWEFANDKNEMKNTIFLYKPIFNSFE